MSLVPPLAGTPSTYPLPNTTPTPAAGETVKASDVQDAAQGLLNQDAALALRVSQAWCKITCNGLGGASVDDHEGVSGVSINAGLGRIVVTFAHAFASANYCPTITSLDGTTVRRYQVVSSTMTTTTLQIIPYDPATGVAINPNSNTCVLSLDVKGHIA